MSGHVVSLRVYIGVFLTLLALTALTTGVAFIDLGPMNTVVALAIAGVKMLLVVLFFMHARYSSSLVKIVILAGFFWLALLISFTLTDVVSRPWDQTPAPWSAPSPAPTNTGTPAAAPASTP
jgi:cytochrome c oxidase subunit IV